MKPIILIVMLISFLRVSSQSNGEPVTNKLLVELHKAGFGKEVLISKIKSSPGNFDLSMEGLMTLKKEGIPDEVISAMLTREQTTENKSSDEFALLSPGIYYFDSSSRSYVEFDASVLTNQKQGGFGEALKRSITGLFYSKNRVSLSGTASSTVFHHNTPKFLFVFDTTISGFKSSNTLWSEVKSPNEFFLIKMKIEKNAREITVGKSNNVNVDIGVDDDSKVKFNSKKIRKGYYEVSPEKPLKSGEYCFMFAVASMYSGSTHKVFDFGIK